MAEGVSNIALVTYADGNVVPHTAVGVDPTKARTRILALAPDASLVRGAVRVDHALRSAVGG